MEEEEAIKRITRLLEMGGTMLASHHDCGAPLFRYKGEVVCPVCSFEEAAASQVPSQAEISAVESEKRPSKRSDLTSPTEDEGARATEIEEKRRREDAEPLKTRAGGEIAHREAASGRMGLKGDRDEVLEELEAAILQKMREISEKMRDETDLGRLKSQLEFIKEALEVLEGLRV